MHKNQWIYNSTVKRKIAQYRPVLTLWHVKNELKLGWQSKHKSKAIKLLEENIAENLHDFGALMWHHKYSQ